MDYILVVLKSAYSYLIEKDCNESIDKIMKDEQHIFMPTYIHFEWKYA